MSYGAPKTSRFILTATGRTYASADFTLEDETPQSRRFKGGLLEGERALAWTVGIPDKDDMVVLARGRVVRGPWGWRPLWQRPFSTYKSPKFYLSFTILVSFILVRYPDRIGLVNTVPALLLLPAL